MAEGESDKAARGTDSKENRASLKVGEGPRPEEG
jgi:hypothetical protein